MNIIKELPPLPYPYDALEPYIDVQTMETHHAKHHATYLNKLNATISEMPELQDKTLEELLKSKSTLEALSPSVATSIVNNGGGVYNHNFFWEIMSPNSARVPEEKLSEAINSKFESFENFKSKFKEAAVGRFGSGWAWLVINDACKLEIISTQNQDTPLAQDKLPILGIDVWEHAYYLKYKNKRDEYIDNWWNIVNWTKAEELYIKATA